METNIAGPGGADPPVADGESRGAAGSSGTAGSERILDQAFTLSVDLLCLSRSDGHFLRLNPAWSRCLGYTTEELLARPWLDFVHPDDVAATVAAARAMELGVVAQFENRYRHRDGSYRWLSWSAARWSEDGTSFAIARDVTEQKRTEEARRAAEERFRGLLESAPDIVVVADPEGRIAIVNAQAEKAFGYPREEMLGRPVEMLLPERLRGAHAGHRAGYGANPRTRHMGARPGLLARRRDGSEFPVDVSLSPLTGKEGLSVISVVRDVTERRRAEESLRRSEAMAAVGQMASRLAHEINNPLTVMMGYLERLRVGAQGDPRMAETVGKVEAATLRVRDLAQGLLDLGRASRMEMSPVRVERVLEETRRMLAEDLEKHNVRVEWRVPPALPAVQGSGEHLQRVFWNLLLNARQAMPQGGTLTVSAASRNGEVRVSVADTGVGISPENSPRLFEPFFTTKRGTGTGLGLAICRSVVSQHGGHIEVESEPGKGATFTVVLPASPPGGAS